MNVLLGWCARPLTLSSLGPRSFHLVCTLFPAFCDTESDLYYRVGLSLKLISGAGRLKLKLISGGGGGWQVETESDLWGLQVETESDL